MKKTFASIIQYLIVFAGFLAMYFFIIPCSDNYFFSRDYENTLTATLWNSLHYGNGRLLGNIIGIGVSQNFIYGALVVALILLLLVFSINKFFFNGDIRTIMPITLIIAFPNIRFISEVYSAISVIPNYVLPIALVFLTLSLLKYSKGKAVSSVLIFILSAASCLFSENTTIVIFLLSVLYIFFNRKNAKVKAFFFLFGSAVGSLSMFLIPKLFHSTDNLESYRGIASGLSGLIRQALLNALTFSDFLASFFFPILIISVILIFLLFRESAVKNGLKYVLSCGLLSFPIESILYTMYAQNVPYSIYMFAVQLGFTIIYFISLFISILCLKKSEFKKVFFGIFILAVCSICPMMIVNICVYRTFYLTYIIFLSLAIYSVSHIYSSFKNRIPKKIPGKAIINICTVSFAVIFLGISCNMMIQSSYNYNHYVARTDYIAEQINERNPVIEVTPVPCAGISPEDEFPSYLDCTLYKYDFPEGYECKVRVVTYGFPNTDSYNRVLEANPISSVINALHHLDYKNIEIIDELTNR